MERDPVCDMEVDPTHGVCRQSAGRQCRQMTRTTVGHFVEDRTAGVVRSLTCRESIGDYPP
jgi:hypothetical protein